MDRRDKVEIVVICDQDYDEYEGAIRTHRSWIIPAGRDRVTDEHAMIGNATSFCTIAEATPLKFINFGKYRVTIELIDDAALDVELNKLSEEEQRDAREFIEEWREMNSKYEDGELRHAVAKGRNYNPIVRYDAGFNKWQDVATGELFIAPELEIGKPARLPRKKKKGKATRK